MDWSELTAYLDMQEKEGIPGCECVVYQDHKLLYHHCAGYSDEAKQQKNDGSELYWLYSASKVSTCTAAMQMIERGQLELDSPVSQYIPAFDSMMVKEGAVLCAAKQTMTVRHLMSMQSGMNYNLNSSSLQKASEFYAQSGTTRQLVEAMAQEPLDFEPGTDFQYSLSHDVLAAVIEAASGLRFGEYLQKNIYGPLGMKETTISPDHSVLDRLAAEYRYQPANHTTQVIENRTNIFAALSSNYESGGAGLISSASDYALLADALACGGVGKSGIRILDQQSIDLMRTPQLCEKGKKSFDRIGKPGYSYGLGVRVMVDTEHSSSPQGEFGWDGAAGAFLMAIPEWRLSMFYVQHVLSCNHAFDVIHPTIRDMACKIAGA